MATSTIRGGNEAGSTSSARGGSNSTLYSRAALPDLLTKEADVIPLVWKRVMNAHGPVLIRETIEERLICGLVVCGMLRWRVAAWTQKARSNPANASWKRVHRAMDAESFPCPEEYSVSEEMK